MSGGSRQGVPRSDARPFFPFERVELGADWSAQTGPGEDPPTLRGTLFYRNRDLAAIEEEWGSLEGMQTASADKPATTLPRLLWLGLRHSEEWADYERVRDLPGRVTFEEDTQIAVARALASAMGSDPDLAERETRKALDSERGLVVAPEDTEEPDEDDEGPPEAVAAG